MDKKFTFARLRLPTEIKQPFLQAYGIWASKQIANKQKHSQMAFVNHIVKTYLVNMQDLNKLNIKN